MIRINAVKFDTDHMEAGGKYKVPKGLNSEKRTRISLSLAFEFMFAGVNMSNNYSRVSNDTTGILKSGKSISCSCFFCTKIFYNN